MELDNLAIFKAIADPTRRQILQDLKDSELSAGEIVERFEISGPSISRHLAILKSAKLIKEKKVKNQIFYSLEPENIAHCLGDFLSSVCPTQILQKRTRRKS